ncbi:MAG: HD domain-containing phosphohydrolase [Treponema sp.]|jgi:HD-GYP domain-containing protein (c-di-GMP phosphodiesterase class II)|nr:HD domain-containing phosphohydrolase [Treponema sp.]
MLSNKKIISALLMFLISFSVAFAQTSNDAMVQRYLERASASFDDGNLSDAYKNINASLNFGKMNDGIIPANVLVFARSIYTQRLKELQRKYVESSYIDIKTNLVEKYPEVNTPELTKLMRQIEANVTAAEKAADKKQQQDFLDSIKESTNNTQTAISDLGEKMLDQSKQNSQQMAEVSRTMNTNMTKIFIVVVICVVMILLIVGLILLIVHFSVKQNHIQQMQYAEAFKLLAANQSQTNQLMIGGIAGLYSDEGLKLAGSSTWSQSSLPEPEDTPEEKEALAELAQKCREIGEKIDAATGRKNNSKNVSEIVFKLATNLGCRQHDAMVYFCAAMVYDVGFLSVEPETLKAQSLSEEQKDKLRHHIDFAEKELEFVPKKYWSVFSDAAKYHHENFDGTGYSEGLKGDKIPQIARIIRVADSYNALSSRRSFRGGMDKESALEKLEAESNLYDPDVLKALEEII